MPQERGAASDMSSTDSRSASDTQKTLGYDEALERVMSLADFERSTHSPGHSSFHLERIGLLMERLGNPHLRVPTVHVAGTKGKGSTAAMITSVLAAQGYKVGLYTSPHLHSAVERIRVGLQPISREDFADSVERIWPAIESVASRGGFGGVTTFEALTAMAFDYFRRIDADFQVIEVGLGGRLDATNIVSPEVSVITSISLDHVVTLGDTVEKIAFEKAGIIKRGVPVVVSPQSGEALAVINRVAGEKGAPVVGIGGRVSHKLREADVSGQSFEIRGLSRAYDLWMPLIGEIQLENAATALATLEELRNKGYDISGESVLKGFKNVSWPARFQRLSHEGVEFLVDGAHNPYSMKRLVCTIGEFYSSKTVIVVFGALSGHSAKGMLEELAVLSPTLVCVRSRHPRSAPSHVIRDIASKLGLNIAFETENVGEGTRRAVELSREDDFVLGTGSLSVAAEIIEEIRGMSPELYPYIKPPTVTATRRNA
ncbi:MAG: bifunctional folylpolyglutamate synthase/dihydrofolate synthase [Chloroflexi bacterium]|nr:bifunctional folylpolyglutamate synthase/dihydrofolate synthase [Chloroflexota bacterium]